MERIDIITKIGREFLTSNESILVKEKLYIIRKAGVSIL